MAATFKNMWWIVLLCGTAVVLPLLLPGNERSFWTYYIATIGISILLASALNLALGYTGLFSMVHNGLYAVAAYASAVLVTRFELPFVLALLVALVISGLLGIVMTLVTLRASNLYFAMITLAFALIIQELAREWDGITGGLFGLYGVPRPTIFGWMPSPQAYYYIIWAGVGLSLLGLSNLVRSKYGRAFRALKLREQAASALGVAPLQYKAIGFTASAIMAGFAGVLFVHLSGFIAPEVAGLESGLLLFVGVFLGGVGTLLGPVIGVIFASGVQQLVQTVLDAQYQQLLFGVILLLTIFLLPAGLVGEFRKLVQRRRAAALDPEGAVAIERFLDPSAIRRLIGLDNEARTLASGEPLLVARDIRKSFGGLQALKGVDLDIAAGSIHGLIGPNGSGKSTLVSCLTAYHQSDGGTITYVGDALPSRPHRVAQAGMVRVFQIPHLFGDMTVLDNVMAGFHLHTHQGLLATIFGLPSARRNEQQLRRDALALLDVAAMAGKADLLAEQLPHGQQRMLEVIRALAVRPRLLILDEPATGLVTQEIRALSELLRRLRDAGVTILLIEHNMAFVMGVCETVTVLEEGSKIAEGSPQVVQRNPDVIMAYLGESAEQAHLDLGHKPTSDVVKEYV